MAVWLAALKQEHPAVGRDAGVCNALYKRGLCQTDMLESAAVPHRACKADVHVLPSANFMQKAKCSQHKQTVVPTQDCAKHVFKTPTSHTELPLHAASHVPSDPLFPVTETRQRSRFFNESMKLCVSVHAHVCVRVHACVQPRERLSRSQQSSVDTGGLE